MIKSFVFFNSIFTASHHLPLPVVLKTTVYLKRPFSIVDRCVYVIFEQAWCSVVCYIPLCLLMSCKKDMVLSQSTCLSLSVGGDIEPFFN